MSSIEKDSSKNFFKQESILHVVGCILSTAVSVMCVCVCRGVPVGDVPVWGVYLSEGVPCWGVYLSGGVSQHALRQTPPYEQND